ncbi:MAG: hypothetical protein IH944_13650 [Armatimonadetes bacterium]|nr:hypothetical protein [Armatimonadota bacterium]
MTRYFRGFFALATGLLLLTSCAKLPGGGGSSDFTKRLVFTMTVDEKIRTNLEGFPYIYIFALRLSTDSNPIDDGPLPVVIPGGNGFVAGNCTHYILWNPLVFPEYQIFKFLDPELNQSVQTGIPINYVQIKEGDNTLQFEIDMSQLVPAGDVDTIKSIQVNFLTMNNTNTGGGDRFWDALGDGRIQGEINSYFTFQLDFADLYTNQNTGDIEPPGDVVDPDLDIIDWSIEVRLP